MPRFVARVLYAVTAVILTGVIWRWEPSTSSPTTTSTFVVTTTLATTTTALSAPVTTAISTTLPPLRDGDLTGFSVTIDPGHNGGNATRPDVINQLVPDGVGMKACDTTGTATTDGYPESAFTFTFASELTLILRQRGAIVTLTRSDDHSIGPCVNARADIGNSSDVAVSLHGDGAPMSGSGFAILTPVGRGPSAQMTKEANRLAGITRHQLVQRGMTPSNYLGRDGIQPRSDLAGLNLSTVPKVMIECANMKNPDDALHLTSSEWRQNMAAGIAEAISVFLRSRS